MLLLCVPALTCVIIGSAKEGTHVLALRTSACAARTSLLGQGKGHDRVDKTESGTSRALMR
eukprot:6879680-Alexandrium_andersonii.AAC.1